jgi:quercetin dioxygenase-like cupin family protein
MIEPTVVRLSEAETVSFGPRSHYQPLLADPDGHFPIRTGIQTAEPGYVAPVHSHPYTEVLLILEGVAEAWMEGQEDRPIRLEAGDTIVLPPGQAHSFRVAGDRTLRLLGTHLSPQRIVNYKDGAETDANGYRVHDRVRH